MVRILAVAFILVSACTARSETFVALDPYLGLPTIKAPKEQVFFSPRLDGVRVRYNGNRFASDQNDAFFTLAKSSPDATEVIDSEIVLLPGDRLEAISDEFYDLRAGSTFVKVRHLHDGTIGYVTLETWFGECTPIDIPNDISPLMHPFGFPMVHNVTPQSATAYIGMIEGKALTTALSTEVSAGTIHPVLAANMLMSLLSSATLPDAQNQEQSVDAARRIFAEYIATKGHSIRNSLAWPNEYDFAVSWGGKLKAPWYSAYSNAVIASAAALMFQITKEPQYQDIARKAAAWMALPQTEKGPLYRDGPFVYVSEFPHFSPASPDLRVLDGEMIAVLSLYNTAILLQDREMLRFSATLAYSLAASLNLFNAPENKIQNARYPWVVHDDSYILLMTRWAAQLWIITKDARFQEASLKWQKSDIFWPKQSSWQKRLNQAKRSLRIAINRLLR